ncbi:hypothetical protein H8356DRAFT_1352188 [Neocallimastix lanati (nom. inval.)]|nr:hypothetical protein H8356DRAFT_1352188 [Neocallimastix sp. JGI-2020a]
MSVILVIATLTAILFHLLYFTRWLRIQHALNKRKSTTPFKIHPLAATWLQSANLWISRNSFTTRLIGVYILGIFETVVTFIWKRGLMGAPNRQDTEQVIERFLVKRDSQGATKDRMQLLQVKSTWPGIFAADSFSSSGADTGIGFEIARGLLRCCCSTSALFTGSRSMDLGIKAKEELEKLTGSTYITVYSLDLCSFDHVRTFVEHIKSGFNHGDIDVLINNAGVMNIPCAFTKDGYEVQCQTNYLSPLLLALSLLPFMNQDHGHILFAASSTLYATTHLDPRITKTSYGWNGLDHYSYSKILLGQKLTEQSSRIKVNCKSTWKKRRYHPGTVRTHLFNHTTVFNLRMFTWFFDFVMLSPKEGSGTALYLVMKYLDGDDDAHSENGRYWADGLAQELPDVTIQTTIPSTGETIATLDTDQLWATSLGMTGVTSDEVDRYIRSTYFCVEIKTWIYSLDMCAWGLVTKETTSLKKEYKVSVQLDLDTSISHTSSIDITLPLCFRNGELTRIRWSSMQRVMVLPIISHELIDQFIKKVKFECGGTFASIHANWVGHFLFFWFFYKYNTIHLTHPVFLYPTKRHIKGSHPEFILFACGKIRVIMTIKSVEDSRTESYDLVVKKVTITSLPHFFQPSCTIMIYTLLQIYWQQWKKNFFYREKKSDDPDKVPALGVFQSIMGLNRKQWVAFIGAYFGFVLEALDFFSTTLSVTNIAADFNVEPSDLLSVLLCLGAITTTMMLRPVGALIFGVMGDKLGRRWPMVVDVILFSVVNLASGFAPDLQTFIALRALFGIIMVKKEKEKTNADSFDLQGAEWGLGTSMALETLPVEVRGLFSGIYQEGWAVGCLLATFINFGITEYNQSWRILFWVGSALSVPTIILRCFMEESEAFMKSKEARRVIGRSLIQETWLSIKHHWYRLIYMFLVMGFLNFMGHATQDLYPTYLTTQLGYSNADRTITIIIYNIGAIVGGCLFGTLSNRWGRRLCIAICCACSAAIIPLWTYSANKRALQFGSFLMQVFVQGGLGCGPAHLGELSPPSLRTTAPGMAYQLGNLVRRVFSEDHLSIEATLGEQHPLRNPDGSIKLGANGRPIADYAYTQSLLTGIVCAVAFFVAVFMGVSEERNKDYNDKVIEDFRSEKSAAAVGELSEEPDERDEHSKEIWFQHEEHSNGMIKAGNVDTSVYLASLERHLPSWRIESHDEVNEEHNYQGFSETPLNLFFYPPTPFYMSSPILLSKEQENLACVIYGANNMHMESRPVLTPQDNEVQINIRATGICGSDLHYHYDGRLGARILDPAIPMVLGHESSGIVTQLGLNSTKDGIFKVGDRVVLEPAKSCGECHCCRTGRYNICPPMKYSSTVQQGKPKKECYDMLMICSLMNRMPDTMTFEEAVAMHAVARSPVTQGSSVVIYGAGTIGLLVASSAHAQGATRITLMDINSSRLDFAKTYLPGIDTVTLTAPSLTDDIAAWAQQQSSGVKDVESCVILAFTMAKSGGAVVLVGLGKTKMALPVDVIATKEINVIGSYRYANIHKKAIEAVADGKNQTLTAHTPAAFETLRKGGDGVLKVQIGDFRLVFPCKHGQKGDVSGEQCYTQDLSV